MHLSCILCHKIIFKKNFFCDYCSSKLISSKILRLKKREFNKIPHYYLFSWNQKNDAICRPLAYFLKGCKASHFSFFASFFKTLEALWAQPTVLVSPRNKREINHARSFALALAKLSESSCVIEIGALKQEEQKQKTRQERLLKNKVYFALESKNWFFVDDVIASGGTCMNTIEAMGSQPSFIFSLFYKEYTVKIES